jgi:hypothetical protein
VRGSNLLSTQRAGDENNSYFGTIDELFRRSHGIQENDFNLRKICCWMVPVPRLSKMISKSISKEIDQRVDRSSEIINERRKNEEKVKYETIQEELITK